MVNRTISGRGYVILFGAICALGPLSIDMGLTGVPLLEREFARQAGDGALTLSLFLVGFCVTPLLSGLVADRFGRRYTLLVSLALYAIAALACAISSDFPSLLLSRTMQGAAAGACVVLPFSIIRESLAGESARAYMANLTAVVGLAPLVAPLVGGLISQAYGWRAVHFTQLALAAGIGLGVLLALPETLPANMRTEISISSAIRRCAALLRNNLFIASTLIYSACFSVMFVFISATPAVFTAHYGVSGLEFSMLICLISGAAFFGSLTTSVLGQRGCADINIIWVGCIGITSCLAVAVILQAIAPLPLWIIVLCMTTVIYLFGLVSPAATHSAMLATSQDRGTASGLIRTVQMVFSASLGLGLSAMYQHIAPLSAALLLMSFGSLCALIAYRMLTKAMRTPLSAQAR